MNIETFEHLFVERKKGNTPVTGLCGRILRGITDKDFETLTDDPINRKIIMLMAEDGLEQILGQSGYESLITIGYEKEYIEYKIEQGNKFKLVVFKAEDFRLATWENVIEVVGEVYGTIIEKKLQEYLPLLKKTPFEDIQNFGSGETFKEIDRHGIDDELYMTSERYESSVNSLYAARAFLYHTIHLRELFAGDGYTYDEKGNRGLKEFITRNLKLDELGEYKLINIDINIP